MLKEFDKNLKSPTSATPVLIVAASSIAADSTVEDVTSETAYSDSETAAEAVEETPSPEALLERLRADESTLSAQIIALESERKTLVSTHRANIKQLRELQDKLIAIKREFVMVNSEYEAFAEKNNQLLAQIATLNDQRRTSSLTLSKVRAQIHELEKITVCVYNDGTFEPLEGLGDIVLDDSGNNEIYQSLLNNFDFSQDLRLKDIRTLARLKAIMTNSTREIVPLFEDDLLGSKFQQL